MLYKNYENQNGDEWNTGKDKNPGAVREESRERSRDKPAKKKSGNEDDDAVSNYSYASNSKKEMREISKKMNNCQPYRLICFTKISLVLRLQQCLEPMLVRTPKHV